jgi:hypothetical protein
MQTETQQASISKGRLWTGRVMSFVPALLLILDGAMKFVKPAEVVKATVELGYSENMLVPLGVVVLVCSIVYLIPRTEVLGAILLTGYLGGAVASHLRHEDGVFAVVFPAAFGALFWGGLVLRDDRLAKLLPITKSSHP